MTALLAAWRARVERAGAHLGWRTPGVVARRHAGGRLAGDRRALRSVVRGDRSQRVGAVRGAGRARSASLERPRGGAGRGGAGGRRGSRHASSQPVIEESAALAALRAPRRARGASGARGAARCSRTRAGCRMCSTTPLLTLGPARAGATSRSTRAAGGRRCPLGASCATSRPPIVTGSNGKTTTVRLLAACARAHGWRAGYNCTDGVFLDDEARWQPATTPDPRARAW